MLAKVNADKPMDQIPNHMLELSDKVICQSCHIMLVVIRFVIDTITSLGKYSILNMRI